MKPLITILVGFVIFSVSLTAQHTEIEYNSSSSGPQLTLIETEDNDFVRLWFQNNAVDKRAFNAKPKAGTSDEDNILFSPIIFAYNSAQKFGISSDGKVRINKAYVLPNVAGTNGQVLTTDASGNVSWQDGSGGGSPWNSNNNGINYKGDVGIGTANPDVTLDVVGAIKVGYEDPATPAEGTIRWNPNTHDFEGYDGSQWRSLMTCSVTGTFNNTPNVTPMCCETFHVASDVSTQGDFHRMGEDVAIYGNYAVVWAGSNAYLYEYDGANWTEIYKTEDFAQASTIRFGEAVAITEDWIAIGKGSFIGSNGQVYMYHQVNGVWTEHSVINSDNPTGNEAFGATIELFGEYLAISTQWKDIERNGVTYVNEGGVFIYQLINNIWQQVAFFTSEQNQDNTNFGTGMSMDDSRLLVSNANSQKVHVVKRTGNLLSQ